MPGSLFIVVLVEPTEFQQIKKEFVRQLGRVLRAVVRIKKAESGEEMIFAWQGEVPDNDNSLFQRTRRWAESLYEYHQWRSKRSILTG